MNYSYIKIGLLKPLLLKPTFLSFDLSKKDGFCSMKPVFKLNRDRGLYRFVNTKSISKTCRRRASGLNFLRILLKGVSYWIIFQKKKKREEKSTRFPPTRVSDFSFLDWLSTRVGVTHPKQLRLESESRKFKAWIKI